MVLKCVSEERGREGGERERRGGERMGEEGREWREGGEREQRVDNKNTLVRVLCCWDSRGKQKTRQGGQTKSKSHQEIDWGQESTQEGNVIVKTTHSQLTWIIN